MGQKLSSPEEQRKNAILKQIMVVLVVIIITATISVLITKAVSDKNLKDTSAGMNGIMVEPTKTETVTNSPEIPVTDSTTVKGDLDYKDALYEYVHKYDPVYSYHLLPELTTTSVSGNSTIIILNMTSQTWSTEEFVGTAHIWWHYIAITIPDELVYDDTALIFVTDGDNTDSPPDAINVPRFQLATQWAERLGMIVATVFQVPNQPIQFAGEDFQRTEDDIIAFTWRYFMTSSPEDPTILLQMPMTKAVVRAMDTVTNVVNSRINRFYLTGISKRAWVVLSTAGVDDRVVGVVAHVFDLLNVAKSMVSHHRSLKGWTFILAPYYKENITLFLDHPHLNLAEQVLDPLRLKDNLTMSKYIVTAGGDEFFLPDNSHYYYDQLPGQTYLRIHPNVGHNLSPRTAFVTSELTSFILSVEEEWPLPQLSWTRSENETHGEIEVMVQGPNPIKITGYKATTSNDERRDFRLHRLGNGGIQPSFVTYEEFSVTQTESAVYIAIVEKPASGWACFFVEMEFPAARGHVLRFTSEVNIIPNTFPWEPCSGVECFGTLV